MVIMQFVARAFVPVLVAFLAGIGLAAYVFASYAFGALFLIFAVAVSFLSMFREEKKRLLLVGVCAIAIAFGIFRFTLWSEAPNDPRLEALAGEIVMLRGMIADEPDVREKNTQLYFTIEEIIDGEMRAPAKGTALLIVDRYPEYRYGDAIEVRGVVKKPEAFSGDDGRIFDYPNYLKAKGVEYQIFYPKITVRDHGQGHYVRAKLFELKHSFLDRLSFVLPEPENALAGGILLGGKRSLGEEWTNRFRETGIVHIIVLSGYNMTIVAEWLGAAFLFLGFYGSLAVSASGILSFALMTGAGATVVRAAIMALLVLLARLTGRTSTMGRGLLVAGVLMVAHNPSILAFDPSFQLSFLASLGLVFVAPLLRERIRMFPKSRKAGSGVPQSGISRKYLVVEEVVVSTLATQIMVLPLILYQTGILSTVALFANVLVLPLIPVTMFFAFVTGLAGFAGNIVAFLPALPTSALLAWILAVGKYGAAFPFAVIHLPPLSGWLVFLAYTLLAWVICRVSSRTKQDLLSQGEHTHPETASFSLNHPSDE
ncbi:MAG: ComEC/Rec2 family competence protein [bacterium]|nr:ComEC/Rec2 family competence protein [bacterium]